MSTTPPPAPAAPSGPRPPRRNQARDIHEAHRVATPLELLFDLVFVVAIAQSAAQLDHGVLAHHTAQAVGGYLLAFGAIWWAWINYTWFASAYDDDSTAFRLLTLLQMGGVLLLATGIPGMFEGQFLAPVLGYVVMRLALGVQWLRAGRGDPARRRTCRRYATGIALVQAGWVLFLLAAESGVLSGASLVAAILALWLCELAVPPWAEGAGATPWHAHHIAKRYGLLVIILLGEGILGATNAVSAMWQAHGWSLDLALVGFAGTLLVFSLWWMYFLVPSADALHHHRERAFVWGYGHFAVFAALAAVGAGLEVVADVLKNAQDAAATHGAAAQGVAEAAHGAVEGAHEAAHGVSALYAIGMVALAEGIYVLALWALYRWVSRARHHDGWLTLVCLACIAAAPAAVALGLPLPWGLLVLSLGPIIAVAYHGHGRVHCAESFAVR